MHKTIKFLFTFMLSILLMTSFVIAADAPPKASADGIVLMDATTGTILYSKNKDVKYPPASTTKIMTALLVLENCKLDDIVTIGKNPPLVDGSKIYLFENEKITVRDLLYGLILQSANDCAEALAEHVSGSTKNFAELMNKRAKELGCENTTFVNPHGLYDENHRTTANDLALILKELITKPEYKNISTKSLYYIPSTNKSKEKRPLWNKNKLVQPSSQDYYKECIGGKTGYTVQSKHSYVAAACKDNQPLIAILLHDSQHTYWTDVKNLFNYGFNNFSLEKLYSKGDSLGEYSLKNNLTIPISSAEDYYYVKSKNFDEKPNIKILSKNLTKSSFKKGDTILNAKITYKNNVVGTLNICSDTDYTAKNKIITSFKNNNSNYYNKIIIAFVIITAILLLVIIKVVKSKRKKDYFYKSRH